MQLKKSRKNWYFNEILCNINNLTWYVLKNEVFWLTLCLVRMKRWGKTRERGKWREKCYFPPFGSAEKTEGKENRRENKSPGPTKIHLPKSGRKQRREKALILKWHIYPLWLSIWVKVSSNLVSFSSDVLSVL